MENKRGYEEEEEFAGCYAHQMQFLCFAIAYSHLNDMHGLHLTRYLSSIHVSGKKVLCLKKSSTCELPVDRYFSI